MKSVPVASRVSSLRLPFRARSVPAKALKYGAKGWSVEVKLADGKTERRNVVRGPQSGEDVEIVSGLEVGQVIIAP